MIIDEKLKDQCRQKLKEQQQVIKQLANSKQEQDDIEYKIKIKEANGKYNLK